MCDRNAGTSKLGLDLCRPKKENGTLKNKTESAGIDFVDSHPVPRHQIPGNWSQKWFAVAVPVDRTIKSIYCISYKARDYDKRVDCPFRSECPGGEVQWMWWDEKIVNGNRIIYVLVEQKTRVTVTGTLWVELSREFK